MISEVILAILALCCLQFIYESTIASSLRMQLRFRLLSLRDELRLMMTCPPESVSPKHLKVLHEGVNNALTLLPHVDPHLVGKIEQLKKTDAGFRKRLSQRIELVGSCQDAAYQDLVGRINAAMTRALIVNSLGGIVVLVVPLAFLVFCGATIKRAADALLFVPESEIKRVGPLSATA